MSRIFTNQHILDLFILNFDNEISSELQNLFNLIFQHNYKVKILDIGNDYTKIDKIVSKIFVASPYLLFIYLTEKSFDKLEYAARLIKKFNYINKNLPNILDVSSAIYKISPADLRDIKIKDATFDFLIEKELLDTTFNLLNFIGDKDVPCQLSNIWYKEGSEFRIIL